MKIWAEFQVPSDLTEWLTLAQNLVGVKNLTNLVRFKFTLLINYTLSNLAQISSRRINFISFQFVCTLNSLPLRHACIGILTPNLKEVWFLENFNSQLPNDILNLYLCVAIILFIMPLCWREFADITRSREWRKEWKIKIPNNCFHVCYLYWSCRLGIYLCQSRSLHSLS